MKSDSRQHLSAGRRMRLFLRLLALTGIVAFAGGVFLLFVVERESHPFRGVVSAFNTVLAAVQGDYGGTEQIAGITIVGGLGIALLDLLIELAAGISMGASSRSAVGATASLQMVLAVAIVAAVNFYSFEHYQRWDLTRNKQFTLPQHVVAELQKLRSPTTILVLQKNRTFGQLSGDPDGYDIEAQRVIVGKVRDLVAEFQEFGRQFRVVVLDTKEKGYDKKLREETLDKPGLLEAARAAPENSILFWGNGKVQRLSFNEFYQLDKTASKAANGGQGNLVLLPQGIDAFARKILAIEEKRPKVAVAVVHEWLTTEVTEGQELFTLSGMKKSLTDYGFDVVDLVLKRNWESADEPEAAAYTFQESKLERLEEEFANVEAELRGRQAEAKGLAEVKKRVDAIKSEAFRQRNAVYRDLLGRELDDEEEERRFLRGLERTFESNKKALVELEKDRQQAEEKLREVLKQERAIEDRRNNDVKAKLTRLLSDCDLLILPRYTLINATIGSGIPPRLHRLNNDQVDVIREFMKSGKPVLACVGPINEHVDAPARLEPLDDVEKLLGDRGVELGRQTIIFDGESKAFAARRAGNALGGSPSEIPALSFEPPTSGSAGDDGDASKPMNPIARAMQITGRSVEQKLDIRIRALRPIYVNAGFRNKLPYQPEFVWTASESWNEEKPFPQFRRVGPSLMMPVDVPRFDAATFDDPKRGTLDEERRGPFPVGVALEAPMPVEWYDDEFTRLKALTGLLGGHGGELAASLTAAATKKDRKSGRLAVVGHGGLFSGKELSPANEKLLLHACNWLLSREERLPRDSETWSYPRVELGAKQKTYWRLGPVIGLPVLFLWVGCMVLIIRRVR